MKIATIGRGNVGSGLAQRWRKAGHEVTEIGSDGGDVSGVEAVLVAIPSNAIEDALTKVTGIGSAVVIDATNAFTGRDEGFESLAHQIKSHVERSCSKIVQLQLRRALRRDRQPARRAVQPLCGGGRRGRDRGAASRDAGFHPISAGGLGSARMLEEHLALMTAIVEGGTGRFFYRYAPPGEF